MLEVLSAPASGRVDRRPRSADRMPASVARLIAPMFDLVQRHHEDPGEAMVRRARKRTEQLDRHQLATRVALGVSVAIGDRRKPASAPHQPTSGAKGTSVNKLMTMPSNACTRDPQNPCNGVTAPTSG